ncbi:aconitase X [Methanobacterium alcaliphilum]|uniref:aconitase X n=1 Tax=Methanobacterium alcaliphilum TaxID=392018 RepID=UPI00200AFFC3|nr:aconitase X catalytic domain-containing protein [Methanobacterium alcaliphilum]MCK9151134.1 aconitase X catalytic domain-containing protein [Methanobacterium alcaliphilum]
MQLTHEEEKMYQGEYGETIRKSMEILVALGDIYEAEELVDITSAQVSGVSYKTIGDAGLEYLEDLAKDPQAKTKVPSTLNPAGVDLDIWEELGFSTEFTEHQKRIVGAYGKMDVMTTCTCTPYLIGNVPLQGSHIAWSESSAVAYGNSVLGARTNREGGPGALAAAICGKTPCYGFHLKENRTANILIEVECDLQGADYGALGYLVGQEVGDGVPYFKMKNRPLSDNLKSLGAALASSGAVALYHVEKVTPEYQNAQIEDVKDKITVTKNDIKQIRENLSTSSEKADLICLGCPHASLEEIRNIAESLQGKKLKNELWLCTSINMKAAAERMGYKKMIEKAGGKLVCDTCMVVAPIEELGFEVIGVDSAKAANYVPSMCGLEVVFDDFKNLIVEK